MVFLYALFGTIQTFVLFCKPRKHEVDESADEQSIRTQRATIATYAEMAYIFIGFLTKTFLGMLLYIGSSV
jgi:hypothetical protein